jgi:L-lactate dehydrogenase complex protein LldG
MTQPPTSRDRILERIRTATYPVATHPAAIEEAYATIPRAFVLRGQLTPESRIALMIERLREYDAEVAESTPETLPAAIATQLALSGKQRFVAPPGLPVSWLAQAFTWQIDSSLTHAEIEQAEGVVTGAFCAIADSGTIVLHHGPAEGRRVLTLLPDWHLCILRASQVVETLPEYFSRCPQPPPLVTWISGPSATADIEMTRIKGVHGPRFLHVILVRDESARDEAEPTLSKD